MVNINSKDDSQDSASHASATSALSGSSKERFPPKDPSGGKEASVSSAEKMGTLGVTKGG